MKKIVMILTLLILIPLAEAVGSLQKKDFAEMGKGETEIFEIIFWNVDNVSYPIKIELKGKAEGFFVFIEPKEFVLPPSKIGPPYEEGEYIALPVGNVKAFPVKIIVKNFNATQGEHEILISALIGSEKEKVSFLMEKGFKLRIKVNSSQETKFDEPNIFLPLNISPPEKILDLSIPIYVSLIFLFIIISIRIYKRA